MKQSNTLIFVATYNEKENVENLYQAIRKEVDCDILFCDDNSPDGTGTILNALAKKDSRVHVLHRLQKAGLGTAHLAAFEYARAHQYDYLLTMDADFTHHPKYIPSFLSRKENADVIIGSRYTHGGTMSNWGTIRLQFTYLWKNLITRCLGMPYDCTGAFRLYNINKLEPVLYKKCSSAGFSFFIESLFYLHHAGLKITEIPIHAQNRIHGKSKLSRSIMQEGAATFIRLFLKRNFSKNI